MSEGTPNEPQRPRLSRSKKVAFGGITCLALLLTLELGQRVSDHRKWSKRKPDWYSPSLETSSGTPLTVKRGSIVLRHDPHLVYVNKPDQSAPCGSINAQGFRGHDWARAKPANTVRIALLGGSAAFGYGAAADDQTFPRLLEERLSKAHPAGREIEVLNAAVIGYDSLQELILLESRLWDYSPDIVVCFDGFNDFYNAGLTPPDRPIRSRQFDELETFLAPSTWRSLLGCSAFYRSMTEKARDLDAGSRPAASRESAFHDHPEGVSRYAANLRSVGELCRANHARAVFVSQPELVQRKEPGPLERETLERYVPPGYVAFARDRYPVYARAASEAASRSGATYADGTTFFDREKDDVFFPQDTVHFGLRGNQCVAEELCRIATPLVAERP